MNIRFFLSILFAISVISANGANAQCLLPDCADKELKLTDEERAQLKLVLVRELSKIRKKAVTVRGGPTTVAADPAPKPEIRVAKAAVAPPQEKPRVAEFLRFYLRKDFEDMNLFSAITPTSSEDAVGASISWSYDALSRDTTWSADGIVAVAYSMINQQVANPFKGIAIGTYFGATREIHSKNVSDNVDVKKFGISGEAGWRNPIFTNRSDYVRGSFSAKQDDIAGTEIANAKLEWLPTWLWDNRTIPIGAFGLTYNFTPEFIMQYDRVTDPTKPIAFSGGREALRVGPEAVLWVHLEPPAGPLKNVINSTFFRLVYHWWEETYSRRTGSWLDASIVHNLDTDGNVALTFGYKRGRNEDTGVLTDLFKASLSAKLCADAFSKGAC
jgi:hypothetical protein